MSDRTERLTSDLWYGQPRLRHPKGGHITVHTPLPADVAGEALQALADKGWELLRITAIGFKDEDTLHDGTPIGKAWVVYADGSTVQAPLWQTLAQTRAIAERMDGVEFHEH